MSSGVAGRLIRKGIRAPSADNSQPWKFKTLQDGSVIDIYLDPGRLANFCDVGLLAPYISAGAVIENISVAAAEERCQIRTEYLPDAQNPLWAARMHLSADAHSRIHPHAQVLEERQTNRKFYEKGSEISTEKFLKLNRIVESAGSCELIWIQKSVPEFDLLAYVIGQADQLRFEIKRLHEELFRMIRFGAGEAERSRDGLDFRTMEAGPGGKMVFKAMSFWNCMRVLNKMGASRLFNFYARQQTLSSSAIGILVSKTKQPSDYIRGGEVMERLWHEMTVQGLALQPMEGLPIFLSDLEVTGGKDLSGPQRDQLKRLEKRFYELSGVAREHAVILLFRAGYAGDPSARSLRRPVESFIGE